ncbi:MAG: helix-turn-helix transcriptional regulator [Candidatus Eisenbacteria bacterium]
MPEQIRRAVRLDEVTRLTALSKSSIRRLRKEGSFPRPFRLSERAIAWDEAEVLGWLAARKAASGR